MRKNLLLTISSCVLSATLFTSAALAEDVKTTSFPAEMKPSTSVIDQQIENKKDSYVGTNQAMELQFDNLIQELRFYKKANPNASDSELNSFVERKLNEKSNGGAGTFSALAYTDMDGYITGILNSEEQKLYNNNKAKALLCMANGKLALGYAEDNYQSAYLHNDNGDAFRHALWNYGMAIDVGVSFAKTWSDAHENGTANNPALEKQMDLFNNGVGLYQYSLNSFPGSISNMISIIKKRTQAGGLEIIRNSKIVNSDSKGEK